jgi:hypothetical protein
MPNRILLAKLFHYGFTSFLQPVNFSTFCIHREVSPLLHAVSYVNFRLVQFLTNYPCVLPQIRIIVGNSIELIAKRCRSKLNNIVLFIDTSDKKLCQIMLFENNTRQSFIQSVPYFVSIDDDLDIYHKLSITNKLFQKIIRILGVLFYRGASVSLTKLTEPQLKSCFLSQSVNMSLAIKQSPSDINILYQMFPFVSSPRSLQTECINKIRNHIFIKRGPRHFRTNLNKLPLPVIIKDQFVIQ